MTPEITLGLIIGGGTSLLLVLFAFFWPSSNSSSPDRLARVSGEIVQKKGDVAQSIRRERADSAIPLFDKALKAFLPNPDKLRAQLEATGRDIKVGVYVLVNALCLLLFFLLLRYAFGWAALSSFLLGGALGLYLPHYIVARMGRRRLDKFVGLFPEAIDTICRGLRSGLPINESIASVGREMPDPVGIEFQRISDSVRMGRSLDQSMWDVSRRLDTPEFRFFIISMAIQKETGGNLAETLGNLSELLRKRRQLRLKIRAMSSEARASAMIIGSLPFIMFVLLYLTNPEYPVTLFTDPRGKILLGFGGTLIACGAMVMKAMINFKI